MFLQYSYQCGLHLVFTLKSPLIWKEHISGLVWFFCLFVCFGFFKITFVFWKTSFFLQILIDVP